MVIQDFKTFIAEIHIIGINPFVFVPIDILSFLISQADKNKTKIPVEIYVDGHPFNQTLVKYAGAWRLYLNTPMRVAAKKKVGDTVEISIKLNTNKKDALTNDGLNNLLNQNKDALTAFKNLSPSLQNEIIKYLNGLKNPESLKRNLEKVLNYLLNGGAFLGRSIIKKKKTVSS